jgi:hypothetical protein
VQKGEWEYLLCADCEDGLNTACEAYFQRVWFSEARFEQALRIGDFQIVDLDYSRFRLFHLSVLWRASVSTRGMYSGIKLGPRYEEQLRQVLLSGDGLQLPGGVAFTADALVNDGRSFQAISDGQKLRFNPAVAVFAMMYAGCVWTFYAASYTPPEIEHRVLRPEGVMPIRGSAVFDYFGMDQAAAFASRAKGAARHSTRRRRPRPRKSRP